MVVILKLSKKMTIYVHKFQTDDDTYIVMENLRHMLLAYDTDEPHYLGAHYVFHVEPNGFNQGGAGYVLSRETLRQLVQKVKSRL